MTEQFKKLLEYQELDFAAESIEKELLASPERKGANKRKQEYDLACENRKKYLALLQKLKNDMDEAEKQLQALVEEAQACQAKIGEETEEYEELQQRGKQLQSVIRQAEALNETVTSIRNNVRQTDSRLNAATASAVKARDEFAVCKEAYEKKYDEAKPALEKARALKEEAEKQVDPVLLEKYKNLRKHKIVPTAQLAGTRCTGCNMELPSAIANKVAASSEIVECENCMRMLYIG